MGYVAIDRTASVVFGPAELSSSMLASGTLAGALDADFSSHSELEIFGLDNHPTRLAVVQAPSKFCKIDWVIDQKPAGESGLAGIIAGGLDTGKVSLWHAVDTNEAPTTLDTEGGPVSALEFNSRVPNLLATSGCNSTVCIWDLPHGDRPLVLGNRAMGGDGIVDLAWNRQAPHILASCFSSQCTIWDSRMQKQVVQINLARSGMGYGALISSLCWNPDVSTQIVTASLDDQCPFIYAWDLRNARAPERTFGSGAEPRKGHEKGINCLSWNSKDRDLLLSGGKDGSCLLWDVSGTGILGDLNDGHKGASSWIHQCLWDCKNPDRFAMGSLDGSVKIGSLSGLATSEAFGFLRSHVPKWHKRTSSSSFSFDGKLARCTTWQGKSTVVVDPISFLYTGLAKRMQDIETFKSMIGGHPLESKDKFIDEFIEQTGDVYWNMVAELVRSQGIDNTRLIKEIIHKNVDQSQIDRHVLLLLEREYDQLIDLCVENRRFCEALMVVLLDQRTRLDMGRCSQVAMQCIEVQSHRDSQLFMSLLKVHFDMDVEHLVDRCVLKHDFFIVLLTLLDLNRTDESYLNMIKVLGERCVAEALMAEKTETRDQLLHQALSCMLVGGDCCGLVSTWIELYGDRENEDLVEMVEILALMYNRILFLPEHVLDPILESNDEITHFSEPYYWSWIDNLTWYANRVVQHGFGQRSYERWTLVLGMLSQRLRFTNDHHEITKIETYKKQAVKSLYRVYRSLSSDVLVSGPSRTIVGVKSSHQGHSLPLPSHWDSSIMKETVSLPEPAEPNRSGSGMGTGPQLSNEFAGRSSLPLVQSRDGLFTPPAQSKPVIGPSRSSLFEPPPPKTGEKETGNPQVTPWSKGKPPFFSQEVSPSRPSTTRVYSPPSKAVHQSSPPSVKPIRPGPPPKPVYQQSEMTGSGSSQRLDLPSVQPPFSEENYQQPSPSPKPIYQQPGPPKPVYQQPGPPKPTHRQPAPPPVESRSSMHTFHQPPEPASIDLPLPESEIRQHSGQSPTHPWLAAPIYQQPESSAESLSPKSRINELPGPPPQRSVHSAPDTGGYFGPKPTSLSPPTDSTSVFSKPGHPTQPLQTVDDERTKSSGRGQKIDREFQMQLKQLESQVKPDHRKLFEDTEKRIQVLLGKVRDMKLSEPALDKIESYAQMLKDRDYENLGMITSAIIANHFRDFGSSAIALKKLAELSKNARVGE